VMLACPHRTDIIQLSALSEPGRAVVFDADASNYFELIVGPTAAMQACTDPITLRCIVVVTVDGTDGTVSGVARYRLYDKQTVIAKRQIVLTTVRV
jgi:hypothetical protein